MDTSRSAPAPEVTVLMAAFNGERYVREAIDSILRQSYGNFEFLIVNDASQDRTRDIIVSYQDRRIRLIDNRENLGLTRSLNRGLRLARGEFIARQDADDISEPDRLQKQVDFLRRHPEVALVGSWYREIDSAGRVIGAGELPSESTDIRWAMLFFCPFVHSAAMFRRSLVLGEVGFYDEAFSYSQDYELWNRIGHRFELGNVPEYLVRLRTSPWSMTATCGDAVEEGARLRIAQFHRIAGDGRSSEEWFRRIRSMLFGSADELDPEEMRQTADKTLALLPGFYREYNLRKAARRTFHCKIRRQIGTQLVQAAQLCFARGQDRAGRGLLAHAARTSAPVVFTKSYLAALLGWCGNARRACWH